MALVPVYEFFYPQQSDHYYFVEQRPYDSNWIFIGQPFFVFNSFVPGTSTLHEFFSDSGHDHYYSTNPTPLDPTWKRTREVGWIYTSPSPNSQPLYQFYNITKRDHYYSHNPNPFDASWTFGGIIGYAPTQPVTSSPYGYPTTSPYPNAPYVPPVSPYVPPVSPYPPATFPFAPPNPAAFPNSVKFGDTIKLMHLNTKAALHSHDLKYSHPNTSYQQQVTAFKHNNRDDFWKLKASHNLGDYTNLGKPLEYGEKIRLEHVPTRRNLHSHGNHTSPVTKQQEVTCAGENGICDFNDDWVVERPAGAVGGGYVNFGETVRLRHNATGAYLHSHNQNFHVQPGNIQQEVTCFRNNDTNDNWSFNRP